MLRKFILGLALLALLSVAALLHYALPSRDIVRIEGTEIIRVDQTGTATATTETVALTRDVRLINASDANGKPRVYRNEDTGWGFPFYLKFDSSDLQAVAQKYAKEESGWVALRHYGWRLRMFSMYPNALSMKPVDGPDATLIPWFNIVFLTIFALVVIAIAVRLRRLLS